MRQSNQGKRRPHVQIEPEADMIAPPEIRRAIMLPVGFPKIVTLCGSTKFADAYQAAMMQETLDGKIVLTVGCMTQSDGDLIKAGVITDDVKVALDVLHKQKIFVADEVLILNVGGYVGESTRSEIAYAQSLRKPIRYLEPIEDDYDYAADDRNFDAERERRYFGK
jgi:hypothetical protein